MTFFCKFWKKARVYYTLSISRGGGGPGPRPPPPLDSPLCTALYCTTQRFLNTFNSEHIYCTELLPIITSIINRSLSSGVFPSEYKLALVRPIIKKCTTDPEILK